MDLNPFAKDDSIATETNRGLGGNKIGVSNKRELRRFFGQFVFTIKKIWVLAVIASIQFLFAKNVMQPSSSHQNYHEKYFDHPVFQSDQRISPHYYLHIPKAGGYGAASMMKLDLIEAGLPKICQHTTADISQWGQWLKYKGHCVVHMAESDFSPKIRRTITMVREPRHHVLSQYFHCTESKAHKEQAHLMPSLDEWLAAWVRESRNGTIQPYAKPQFDPLFKCYKPVNLQSELLGHPRNATVLAKRFKVIGLLSEIETSSCLMSISVIGQIPSRCNCTDGRPSVTKKRGTARSHGVQHHGASFNTTEEQERMIDILTRRDTKLYNDAKRVFARHVEDVERRFGVTLC